MQAEMFIPKESAGANKQEIISLDNSKREDVKLIVFGCSGYGKSSTINSIMGFHCINTSSEMLNTEQIPALHTVIVNDVKISCVDTPGIEEDKSMSHIKTIKKSLELFNNNFSGLLLVLKYGERFTQQTKSIVKSLKGILGAKVIEDCCVCVMTHGGQFVDDMRHDDEPLSFVEWCRQQDAEIGLLFQECKCRCILFNNKIRDESKMKTQVDELMSVVKTLRTYTNSDFESITEEREKFLVKCSIPEITDKANKDINTFRLKLQTIETIQDKEVKIGNLNLLLTDIEQYRLVLPPQAKITHS